MRLVELSSCQLGERALTASQANTDDLELLSSYYSIVRELNSILRDPATYKNALDGMCALRPDSWGTGGLQRHGLSHAIEWPLANRCAFIYWKRAGSKLSHITFDSRSSICHPIQFTLPTYTTPRSSNVILLMKTRNGLCISFYVPRYGYSAYPHYVYKGMYNRTRQRGLPDRLPVPKII